MTQRLNVTDAPTPPGSLRPRTADLTLAHALARIGLGVNMCLHGMTRIPGMDAFQTRLRDAHDRSAIRDVPLAAVQHRHHPNDLPGLHNFTSRGSRIRRLFARRPAPAPKSRRVNCEPTQVLAPDDLT